MAFFCTKTGIRLIAPGVHKDHGGSIPEYDGTPKAFEAELACSKVLRSQARGAFEAPSEATMAAGVKAALDVFDPKSEAKAEAKPVAKVDPKPAAKAAS